jgi:hypothetical protein
MVEKEFNIINGLIGMERDIFCLLVKGIGFNSDNKIRSV